MNDLIKKLLAFLLPFLRQATLEIVAESASRLAYPDNRRRGYTSYNRMAPPTRRQATINVGRAVREANAVTFTQKGSGAKMTVNPNERFHDVLMIAFDISGPSQALVEAFLMNYLPGAGTHVYHKNKFNLDAYWVADDNSDDDCDSAVFVAKGKQEEARALLRQHGLVG